MKRLLKSLIALPVAVSVLSGCGIQPYAGPKSVIAKPMDGGLIGRGPLQNGHAGVVYDPDGCQGWLIDDGLEGYSGRRFDPVSGLPICNNLYPPGTVIGNYQNKPNNIRDWVVGTTN